MIYVLDTDHISLHQRGYEPLKHHLSAMPPDHLCMTIVSAEELLRGRLAQIRRATRPDERIGVSLAFRNPCVSAPISYFAV